MTSKISMDRVPVAVLGGTAGSKGELISSSPTHNLPCQSTSGSSGQRDTDTTCLLSPLSRARMMALYQPSFKKGEAGLSTRCV